MIVNPKIESLRPEKLKLEGYFISADDIEVLTLTLNGLRNSQSFKFDIYPVQGQYDGVKENSLFLSIPRYQKGLTDKLLKIAKSFNQESILANLDTQAAILYTDKKKPVKFLNIEIDSVMHKEDLKLGKNDHSLIDLGGSWYQFVMFK